MKRLRSSDDLDSYGEKAASKDLGRKGEEESSSHRSLTHRTSNYKSDIGRKGVSSSSRYDRLEDDRGSAWKRSEYDADSYDRRKNYDRYRESSNERGISSSSPRGGGYGSERFHRSESFSGLRREFPKGFRSERDRSRREGSVSSWRKFGAGKEGEEGIRSSSESAKISKVELEDVGKVKSPQGIKDAKSPPWSKDSGSEQSKSIEVKKDEELPAESVGKISEEREEGELEPEPQPAPTSEPTTEDPASDGSHQKGVDAEQPIESKLPENKRNQELGQIPVPKEPVGGRGSDDTRSAAKPADELPRPQSYTQLTSGGCDEIETTAENDIDVDDNISRRNIICKEEGNDPFVANPQSSKVERRGDKGVDLEDKTDESDLPGVNKGLPEETGTSIDVASHALEEVKENFKEKGKAIAFSSSNCSLLPADESRNANESRSLKTCSDSPMEGPSTRGFELFFTGPVKKPDKEVPSSNSKIKDEKLTLDLSLSLPNVLLPIGSNNIVHAPCSPSQARSVQSFNSSFRTDSDGFTASMSFSGSQQFTHNPSCSLTHNELDFEQSVKSRPLFQGVDWQALASEEPKNKEVTIVQSMLPNGNGLHQQPQASQGNSSSQPVAQRHRTIEGSFGTGVGLEQQLSFNKQLSVVQSQHPTDVRSPAQSVGSHETGSGYLKDKKRAMREKDGGSIFRISKPDSKEQLWTMGSDFLESIITMVVSEPINTVANRFAEMSGQQMAFLKESVRDIILNPSRQWQRRAFQKALEKRSDFTLEKLVKSHRFQLEILVAMKTGLQEFLHRNNEISSSELAEVFLNLRCRNLTCRSLLPVNECDCKICSRKNGFCSDCMCLVCSKFDMASNTCSWVGCDVCLHWCHADCGLREAYIRNGRSPTGAEGTTEMQFHCLACDHPSEMFGFVKEVFQNFAKEWTEEHLSRELKYVRKIFSGSEDLRGKRLHDIAIQMLSNLENKVDLQEVQNHIMRFLNDSDSFKHCNTPIMPRKELSLKNDEKSNGIVGSSQESPCLKQGRFDKASQFEKSADLFASMDGSRDDKRKLKLDSQTSGSKEHHVFDELESIVRIKHAEAKMFQSRADDARREAEALKRIALSKNEKIEEEYTSRISKLRLSDAEEMRKQKLEELQSLERSYQEYFHMKMRMEVDIKDLLLKMDATRRNLTL